jgi:hypothetical protein
MLNFLSCRIPSGNVLRSALEIICESGSGLIALSFGIMLRKLLKVDNKIFGQVGMVVLKVPLPPLYLRLATECFYVLKLTLFDFLLTVLILRYLPLVLS